MLRSIYFYMAVCCAAFALANLVWASPPSKVSPMSNPMPIPKATPSAPLPKVTPIPLDLKLPAKKTVDTLPILDKKFTPIDPKVITKTEPKVTTKVDPKTITKVDPKITGPLVLTKPSAVEKLASAPSIKLGKDSKFDVVELTKIKPPIDLTKTSGDKLVKLKPPVDFKVKPMELAKIQIPADAMKVAKLNAKLHFKGEKFILNKDFYKGLDYHLKFGVKHGFGYCYPGHHHCHWHHCVWDPCCGCYYYYDPCCSCYYYWCAGEVCYYPCWWFVDYCGCYYPWWVCGGFDHWGYHCHHHHRVAIRIGW